MVLALFIPRPESDLGVVVMPQSFFYYSPRVGFACRGNVASRCKANDDDIDLLFDGSFWTRRGLMVAGALQANHRGKRWLATARPPVGATAVAKPPTGVVGHGQSPLQGQSPAAAHGHGWRLQGVACGRRHRPWPSRKGRHCPPVRCRPRATMLTAGASAHANGVQRYRPHKGDSGAVKVKRARASF
ncbi:hypothetical protein GW17_00060809 [Ensete ventricosum]|nr:hypothetical protein GW17_00060809 [Ensete ventricosum]